jgi:RNA polymerase sigma-70 factor, ECF subfamily
MAALRMPARSTRCLGKAIWPPKDVLLGLPLSPHYNHRKLIALFYGRRGAGFMDAQPEGSQGDASNPSSISSTLLDQLRSRRPEAWQRVVRLYGPVIYRWCRRSNLHAEDAADVAQEVLSAVMTHLPNFRRDRPQDSFGGWLATITRNKVREHYRRQHGKAEARGGSTAQHQMAEIPQPPEPSEENIQPDAQSAACLSRRALEMIRAEFEPRTWEAFWRVNAGGQLPSDVASDLGMSVPAVHMAKYRVLRRLRKVLGDLPE